MDIYIKSKIDGLEDHINDQDKTIQGWIEVSKIQNGVIEQYQELVEDYKKQVEEYRKKLKKH